LGSVDRRIYHGGRALTPPKKEALTDAERAKRIRDLAREAETDNDPKSFERAFEKVIRAPQRPAKPVPQK